jgi:hypothetical protein
MDILRPIRFPERRLRCRYARSDRAHSMATMDIFRHTDRATGRLSIPARDKCEIGMRGSGRREHPVPCPRWRIRMEKVSLTYFVDFVLRSGTPKLTGVREYKERKDELSTDFYRPIREGIIAMHRKGECEAALDGVLARQDDHKRKRIYPHVATGYRKFLASGDKRWFEPPQGEIKLGDLSINLNPEVGFLIDKKPHLVKLYFRQEPLTTKRSAVVLALLQSGLGRTYPKHTIAMLDVQRARLHTAPAPNPRLEVLLRGEAAAFSTIYEAL